MADHDHTVPFCEFCYNLQRESLTQNVSYEDGTSVKVLILSDTYAQAYESARRNHFPLDTWIYISGVTTLEKFPRAQILCVKEEILRADLNKILTRIEMSDRQITYEAS